MGVHAFAHRLLRRLVDVQPQEVRATLLGFAWFFCLLAGYYLLRPLRDAMGLQGGPDELQWLFTATFVAMLVLVPLFGALVTRLPPRRFVPLAYRFFSVGILAFCALLAAGIDSPWPGRVFFVWLSVFNLFVISIFWSVLADCFSNAQGRRLFGFVAAGGTAGTFVGPALAASLATTLGPACWCWPERRPCTAPSTTPSRGRRANCCHRGLARGQVQGQEHHRDFGVSRR